MIKLTQLKEHEDAYDGVRHHFIPVDKIVAVNEGSGSRDGRACLWLGAHDSIVVQESAEEVVRMIKEAKLEDRYRFRYDDEAKEYRIQRDREVIDGQGRRDY